MANTEDDKDKESYILVVDDDETLLKFFKIHLNKFVSKIVVVKNAREAVNLLQEKKIDLVISDIRMPRLDGIQLMKKVKNFDPSIPVFLVSGAMLDDSQIEAVENKADGFLKKPFSIDDLDGFLKEGLRVSEIYRELFPLVGDKKKFLNLIRGKSFPKMAPEDKDKAKGLMERLKAS